VSTGIAGGDVAPGSIAATTAPTSASAPRASDVDAALFGSSTTPEASRASERQRDLEPIRETADTRAASPATARGAKAGASVTGRAPTGQVLSAWLAGVDNPVAVMRRMQEELDSVFRAFGIPRFAAALSAPRDLDELLARTPTRQTAPWSPQIEVFERDGNLIVHADLPGVKRDDVEVNVDNDVLTIRGQRRQENREAEGGYRRTERSYGSFFRQIPLPDGVDPTEIEAAYEDGVLQVIVPAPRAQQSRRRVEIR
jgi:HSP20 family protein